MDKRSPCSGLAMLALLAALLFGLAAVPAAGASTASGSQRLVAWGYNGQGDLGNGSTTSSDVPGG